jgi:hypothetical protein
MGEFDAVFRRRCVGIFVACAFCVVAAGLFLIFVQPKFAVVSYTYTGYGLISVVAGLIFGLAGLYVWRLFYEREDEAQKVLTPQHFLSRAWQHRLHGAVGSISFFPDRLLVVWLILCLLQGVVFLMDVLGKFGTLHSVVWYGATGVIAGLLFFSAQAAAQMLRTKWLVCGLCAIVFLITGITAFWQSHALDFDAAFEEPFWLFGVASIVFMARFVRFLLGRGGGERIWAIAGALFTVLLGVGVGIFGFGFMWVGFAAVGAVSGGLYRPRERVYRLY